MRVERFVLSLVAYLLAAMTPAGAAGPGSQAPQLYPRPKSPLSDLFRVSSSEPGIVANSEAQVVAEPLTTEVHVAVQRDFTPRMVCGVKMIEGTADMDPRIVIPIPERHGAKIRVLGPPPCDEVAGDRTAIVQGGFIVLPDRR